MVLVGKRVKERRDDEKIRAGTIKVVEDGVGVGFVVCVNPLFSFLSRDPHCKTHKHQCRKKEKGQEAVLCLC